MSVSSKAVLVVFGLSGIPEPKRQDKKVRGEVAKRYRAEENSVLFHKFLWNPEAPTYVSLKQWATRVREWNYFHTTAYAHDGARFLKTTEVLEYLDQMRKFENEGKVLFNEFLHDYSRKGGLKDQAKKALNGLYDESIYPSEKKLRSRFNFEVTMLPVPDAGHVMLDLATAEVTKAVRASTEKAMKEATALALKDAWTRLHEVTQNMAAALSDPDRRFHDTLVGNVKELCDVLPALNITDDPELEQMGQDVKKALTKFGPQALRDDEDKRAATAKKARELAEKMAAYMR